MAFFRLIFERLTRRKYISAAKLEHSNLDRCLSVFDLTALGVGSTLGLGIYVLAGKVAKEEAGPSIVLSFLIAAIASVFAGFCYAEFASRVPRAGSAYVYSYVTVGELVAFIIGWNLILEYVIGAASVARGYSGYFDSLLDKAMTKSFHEFAPMNIRGLSPYPDFFAFGMTLILTIILSVGVKESSKVNNVLTCLNIFIVAYVVICGAFKADVHNWKIPKKEVPKHVDGGDGGFFPFGFSGMMAGAATCFYGFVGFDCVATTGEEARNPQRAIPIAIVLCLLIVFLSYFGVSAVVTLMVPYYLQDPDAAIPAAFEAVGWPVARWIISIGALAGLSTSLLGAMFPLPRILYAMANDGLIFRWLSHINPRFKTPLIATVISGLFAAVMAMLFELTALVDMMSIGTLLAYTLVAASVLILRYRPDVNENSINEDLADTLPDSSSAEMVKKGKNLKFLVVVGQLFNIDRHKTPSYLSGAIVSWATLIELLLMASVNAMLIFASEHLASAEPWAILLLAVLVFLTIMDIIIIGCQPSSNKQVAFKVPWVPFVPSLSCFINTYLMLKLSLATWLRFGVWMAVGFSIYFLYGIRQSSEEFLRKGLQPPNHLVENAPPLDTAHGQTVSVKPNNEESSNNVQTATNLAAAAAAAAAVATTVGETVNDDSVVVENREEINGASSTEEGSVPSISSEPPSYNECLKDADEIELDVITADDCHKLSSEHQETKAAI